MRYRAFGDFRKGYAHVKNGSGVEDYASSYNDPEGRFHIGVICDGHSDKNCFRSAKGARFGCESAIEILTRFFELYLSQDPETRALPDGFEVRLKKSIKLCWDKKVYSDIMDHPLKEIELNPLTERVRKIYEAGNGLLNIYGATFLAIAVCEDFFIAFHIGDGVILCIDEDGSYYSPVPQDPKSETGSPASLCDSDLFSREHAFRFGLSKKLPQLVTVSSDGIEDCMDSFEYKKFTETLFKRIERDEDALQPKAELNERQKRYFGSCLEYYADKGHGAEDDCSLAAIYDLDRFVPEVRMSNQEALKFWERTMQARNEIVSDYEKRKKSLLESMSQVYNSAAFKGGVTVSMDSWIESHEKFEDQKRILRTIVTNENDKIAVHEKQLEAYAQYIIGFSDDTAKMKRLLPQYVDAVFLEPDEEFENLKIVRLDYLKKQRRQSQLKMDLEETTLAIDDAKNLIMKLTKLGTNDADGTDALMKNTKEKHQTIKAEYEHALREYEEAEETYERMKSEYSRNRKKNNLDFRSLIKGAGSPGNTQFGLLFKDKGGKSKDAQSAVTSGKDDSGTTDPDDQGADTQKKAGSADAGQKNRANYQDIDIPWTW